MAYSGQGTRDSAGNLTWACPAQAVSVGMAAFSQFDQSLALTTTQDDLDLTAINLDGSGAKDLTGLVGYLLVRYVSGSGSVLVKKGTTNGYDGAAVGGTTVGGASTSSPFAIVPFTVASAIGASNKTLDLTVTGTITYSVAVFAGAAIQ